MKRFLLIILLIAFGMPALAQDLEPLLQLKSIKPLDTEDAFEDEIYFVVTEFSSTGTSTQYTIPQYPVTWPSQRLGDVKNVKLWQGVIGEKITKEVIIELVDHDAPPYNVDDTLGSIRIKMSYENGNLVTSWVQDWAKNGKHAKSYTLAPKKSVDVDFDFKESNSDYKLAITLQNNVVQNNK